MLWNGGRCAHSTLTIPGSDATVQFGPVHGWKSSNLKPGSSPVRQFWTEPLPYLVTVHVISHCRTWIQVWFKQLLNFEPDFGQVRHGSGSNFGSGPNRGITNPRGQHLNWAALFQQQAHCHTLGPMVLCWVCIKDYGCPGMVEEWFWWRLDFLNMLILWLIINTYQLQYNTLLDEYNMVCGMLLWIWLQYNMAKNII